MMSKVKKGPDLITLVNELYPLRTNIKFPEKVVRSIQERRLLIALNKDKKKYQDEKI